MNLTLRIPDDIGQWLSSGGEDLSRRAFKAFAVEEYRAGHLSLAELRRLLGFATRSALNDFLKSRGVFAEFTLEGLDRDLRNLQRVGL